MTDSPVVNASPLIVLSRAGRLDLLHHFSARVVVPVAVAAEVAAHSDEAARALASEAWLQQVPGGPVPDAISAWDLGAGESAVLAWALAHPGTVAVLDDYAARECAEVLGVPVRGTLGLVLAAKARGHVVAARPVIEELQRAGLYLSAGLVERVLSLVDE